MIILFAENIVLDFMIPDVILENFPAI